MSIEVMKQALDALEAELSEVWTCNSYHPSIYPAMEALRTAIQQAEAQQPDSPSLQAVCRYISDVLGSEAPSGEKHIARTIMHLLPLEQALSGQQPATPEPVLFIHPDTFAMNNAHVGAWKPGHELTGYIPLYTHPASSVLDDVMRDAERYRWLKAYDHNSEDIGICKWVDEGWSGQWVIENDPDTSIDAAMLAAK